MKNQNIIIIISLTIAAVLLIFLGFNFWNDKKDSEDSSFKNSQGSIAENTPIYEAYPTYEIESEIIDQNEVLVKASASSVLEADKKHDYIPGNTLDYEHDSVWSEGIIGSGVGEWIMYSFDNQIRVTGISIFNGYCSSWKLYRDNNRPKMISVFLSDNIVYRFILEDLDAKEYSMQQLCWFPEECFTDFIKIRIDDVYQGDKYDDTCISDCIILL